MPIFEYGHTEIDYLTMKDEMLGKAMKRIGMISRDTIPDPFEALISSIVSQQISKKAAASVWSKLQQLLVCITPETVNQADKDEIQKCGISFRKVTYIKGVAEASLANVVNFPMLNTLTDQEIITKLSSLYGVGVWTAEMILIFSLNRSDVVSYKDLAIRRGMMNLYGLTELPIEVFQKYRDAYSPYGSVASLYLWELSVT